MIEKVISGGQTGADIAGLRAAVRAGIDTGGFIPKGYRTLDGPHPEYEQMYNLVEIDTYNYSERTRLNVMQSDCTIRFAFDFGTPGERCTQKWIHYYAKPSWDVGTNMMQEHNALLFTLNETVKWVKDNDFKIINIAGNAEKRYKGIEELVETFCLPLFERVNYDGS